VLERNAKYAHEHIQNCYPGVQAALPQGTYVIFLDLTEYCRRTGRDFEEILHAGWDVGVGWQDGRAFQGPCHIRMNLALPFDRVQEAFDRLDRYVFVK
jgi:cystathionine beta-lyase